MVDLQHPDVITSTNLRKYVATVSQLIDMDHNELGWLATHLGHDIQIHKQFYRMQESTLEMAVVGNLLMAIDEGRAHQFKGKNLRDITLQGTVKIRALNYNSSYIIQYIKFRTVQIREDCRCPGKIHLISSFTLCYPFRYILFFADFDNIPSDESDSEEGKGIFIINQICLECPML